MSHHQPTKDYVARRTAQDKSKRSMRSCHERYVAQEIYDHLTNPQPAESTADSEPGAPR